MTDETLYNRAIAQPKSLEDSTFDSLQNEQLRLAIQSLPDNQRKRFVLHHEFGFTYEQIADLEGRKRSAICESVKRAEEKVREILKKFMD